MNEKEERTDKQVADSIREWVYELNRLLGEAADRGLDVHIYLHDIRSMGDTATRKTAEVTITRVSRL